MAEYQQLLDPMTRDISDTVLRRRDSAYIPDDPANRDRQTYVEWCEAGNTPDPPDPVPETVAGADPVTERLEALEARVTALEQTIRSTP